MPTNARKKHWIGTGGPWGTGLLMLGIGYVFLGFGYAFGDSGEHPPALREFSQTISIHIWSGLWVAAGVWGIAKALKPPQQHSDMAPLIGVAMLWTAMYFVHWVIHLFEGEWNASWRSFIIWGCLTTLIVCLGKCVNPPHDVS